MEKNKYYVYTLAYPDGNVFYVGKGYRYRINQHESDARRGVSSRKCDVIRQIWERGGKILKTKVKEGLTEEEALTEEYQLILQYGAENLTNEKIDPYSPVSQSVKDLITETFGSEVANFALYGRRSHRFQ